MSLIVASALALALALAAPAVAAPSIAGTWNCCGSGGAAAQTWTITSATGALTGTVGQNGTVVATITGSITGTGVTIISTSSTGYVATFTGTLAANGATMSGSWSDNSTPHPQSGTWAATLAAPSRPSATQVNCYDSGGGGAADYVQCTAAVSDAGGQATVDTPTGTVAFTVTAGSAGGFPGASTCTLAPFATGASTAYCAVTYVAPAGAVASGGEPPISAAYSGDATFAASSGQPETLQAVQAAACAVVYEPVCAGVVAAPADLAGQCVSLGSCSPGTLGAGGGAVQIATDQKSLVVNASCTAATPCQWAAYLAAGGGPQHVTKGQYTANAAAFVDAVAFEQGSIAVAAQDALAQGAMSAGYTSAIEGAENTVFTAQIDHAFTALAAVGTSAGHVSAPLDGDWCSTAADPALCRQNVAALESVVSGSIGQLAGDKATLGVNARYTARAPRTSKHPRHAASTIVIAAAKSETVAPGQVTSVRLPIPAAVRSLLASLLRAHTRTLRANLVIALTSTSGDLATATAPVVIHLRAARR